MTVLGEPGDPVALGHAKVAEHRRAAAGPLMERRKGEALLAADHRGALGEAARVLVEQVAQRQGVQSSHPADPTASASSG